MSVTFLASLFLHTKALPLMYRRAEARIGPPAIVFPTTRTLFNIIWSCMLALLVCASLSVHPNVPPKRSRKGLKRRLKLAEAFWVLVTPEFVLAWALRQHFAAVRVFREYNNKRGEKGRWNLYHGHFVVMGGYILLEQHSENPDDGNVLSFELFLQVLQNEEVDFPITTAEILDRSKIDGLGHLVAIIQVSWFMLQCLVRYMQRQTLTQLELITLTPVICTIFTKMLWFWKPQDIQVPVKIRLPPDVDMAHAEAQEYSLGTRLSDILFGIIRAETVSPGASHVPTFYAPKTRGGTCGRILISLIFGVCSGVVLYKGMDFTSFATAVEWKVWHLLSLAAIIILILLSIVDFMIEKMHSKARKALLKLIFGSLFLLYVIIKLLLIAQAFALLRSQPPIVFTAIDWTKYIPHIL